MNPSSAFRSPVITLALLTACLAASAQVTVDPAVVNTFSDQSNRVAFTPSSSPSTPSVLNTSSTFWVEPSLTHSSDLASVTREGRTSTADSNASGVLSGTPLSATFTTSSWASVVSDNRFSRPSSGIIRATSNSAIDNTITFNVGQLSNYIWSATFASTVSGTANSSTDPYFELLDSSFNLIAGCLAGTACSGSPFGSGQLIAGTYFLNWGGSVSSISENVSTMGTLLGSAEFTQTGLLTVTAVPEPETYALMLAGVGVLGFVASRRKQKAVA